MRKIITVKRIQENIEIGAQSTFSATELFHTDIENCRNESGLVFVLLHSNFNFNRLSTYI